MEVKNRAPWRRPGKGLLLLASGLLALVVVVVVIVFLPARSGPALLQPIQFNHQVHTKLAGCVLCHRDVESRELAGKPELFRCMLCHAYVVSNNPEVDKLRAFSQRGQPIPWIRHTRVAPFVRFSHERHVVAGKVDCKSCHGNIAQATVPPVRPLVPISMQFCLDCHLSKTLQLSPGAARALKAENVGQDVLGALQDLEHKRFNSSGDLVAAVTRITGTAPSDVDKQRIVNQLHPAKPVTTDCFACHR